MSDAAAPPDAEVRIVPAGELSIYTVAEIHAQLAEAIKTGGRVNLDLSEITEMDTAGLQLLLLAVRDPHADVAFLVPSPAVRRLVRLANVGHLIAAADITPDGEPGGAS